MTDQNFVPVIGCDTATASQPCVINVYLNIDHLDLSPLASFASQHLATLAPQPARKRKKSSSAANDDKEFTPLLDTFKHRSGLTDQHFALLFNTIQREGWLDESSDMEEFVSLFKGKPSDCHVVWNRDIGKGVLRDLFRMMIDGRFIKCPEGLQYIQIIESHFIYPDGTPVRGLKGGYASKKAKTVISDCRSILLINPKAKNYSSMAEEIADEFSDLR